MLILLLAQENHFQILMYNLKILSLSAVDATSSITENKEMGNTFKIDFGKRIKELRTLQNITQEELSFRSGVSRSHIGMIEKGLRDISLTCIFKLSRALNTPINAIFNFADLEKYKNIDSETIFSCSRNPYGTILKTE